MNYQKIIEKVPPLGLYNSFDGRYFNDEYYLLSKFGQRIIELNLYEFFPKNHQTHLNRFLQALEKNGFAPQMYKKVNSVNAKKMQHGIDWYLFLDQERIIINIEQENIKDLENITFRLSSLIAVEEIGHGRLMEVAELAKDCQQKIEEQEDRYIHVVGSHRGSLSMRPHKITEPNIPDLPLYYGDKLETKHRYFVEALNAENRAGLFIFHGVTGSGKTNYIRYLIHCTRQELTYIFYPISLLRDITNPDLITFLSDYQDAVLIIEESEDSVQDRDRFEADKASIANLLNVSDGLLSDVLNLKIICTFNTDIRNLDKALLREGRLLGIHRFDRISADQANQIATRNKLDKQFDKPVTLAEIFNQSLNEDLTDFAESKHLGFHRKS
ncbi:MAG: AAA family ATPase [Bernardetiaceae bacterium]